MGLVSDSSNGGFVPSCLYISWSLSCRLFSIKHMVVPSGLCNIVCVCCVGCCASSYRWVGCVSRSGLMVVVKNMRIGDLHPPGVLGFACGVRHFIIFWVCSRPLSHSVMVDSNCHDGCQCTA